MEETDTLLNQSLENTSVVDQIIERITQSIVEGELKPGDKIPTEYELAKSLHVGRNSIREAIKVLTHFRVLTIERAKGTFVSDSFQGKMLDPLLLGLILQKDNFTDIMGLRQVFDTGIIGVVVNKNDSIDLKAIDGALENLHTALFSRKPDPEDVLQKDCLFHMAVSNSLNNPLVTQVANYVDRITIPSRTVTMKAILKQHDEESFFKLHQSIVDVIKNHRADKVYEIVQEHYQYWRKN